MPLLKLLGPLLIKTQLVFNHFDAWLETAPLGLSTGNAWLIVFFGEVTS